MVLSVLVTFPIFAGTASAPLMPGDLLGSTGLEGQTLILIDPATGAGTVQGPLNTFGFVTEIEFRQDGTLFGTTDRLSQNLITIDPVTGVQTLIGTHGSGPINGLEFVGDTLYGTLFADVSEGTSPTGVPPTQLVTIDTANASLTLIAEIEEYTPVRGLAYDPATDTMYGVGGPEVPPEDESIPPNELFTIDLETGETTTIGTILGTHIVGGIELGPDGLLYGGVAFGLGSTQDGDLIIIDTESGLPTVVGPTGAPAISGLAFVPAGVGSGPPAVEVPAASSLGLFALLASLMVAGVFLLRRAKELQPDRCSAHAEPLDLDSNAWR